MPSARDPNPPFMNSRQIADFQQSIEKVHKEGETMLDPDSLPSPRTRTPEERTRAVVQPERRLTGLDGQEADIERRPDAEDGDGASDRRYYSPEEVGKQRFSTIWEELPAKSNRKFPIANPDGSFLGCKEINGPYDKNPDEILLFSTTDERPRVIDIPSARAKIPPPKEGKRVSNHRIPPPSSGKPVTHEEWRPISQNLKPAQCSRPSPKTMCRETNCSQRPDKPETSAKAPPTKETPDSASSSKKPEKQKVGRRPDDVFIITPTITRTMVTMADLRGHPKNPATQPPSSRAAGEIITDSRVKHQAGPSASGLRRATQNGWERSSLPCATSLSASPPSSIPTPQGRTEPERTAQDKPKAIRGFIRTTGLAKPTGNRIEPTRSNPPQPRHEPTSTVSPSPRKENFPPSRSASDSTQTQSELSSTTPEISPATSLSRDRPVPESTAKPAKTFELAELDGQQVTESPKEEIFHSNITDFNLDSHDTDLSTDLSTKDKEPAPEEILVLVKDGLIKLAGQLQGVYDEIMTNRHSKAMLVRIAFNSVLKMVEHCLHVLKDLLTILALYNTTGAWPKPNRKDFAWSLVEICQAMIYLVTLGVVMIIIGRAAGYVVLVGSWIVWFAKPFAWFLGTLGRALLI
ncbi:hypothetical protein BO70DRAFT_364484 [Aspergillus heteromorphus CBS 117.55]|uniref:NTP binding protein n=1 Tax=Aspergillus heteromorphus CBS 117.55 TaxID=1448321 RepID=A0A317VK15_9EURO|nr:uncharacterized protein BO70DRAFT_364484 [Aspergillus heteromorphus CBS 117.55]PWY73591.1 hypothetical protein BO70DRAFT_364484 [Aspergillus heteromorphus CBS 117.55]